MIGQAAFLDEFNNPPAEYFSAPLWVWNDDITEEEIAQQLDMLHSQRVLQAFVHPRPGLITPYLSERWLDLYTYAVKAAKERGMLLHIYDENSYPSGFAGGHVPAQHPEWKGKGLVFEKVDSLPEPLPENTLAAYRIEGNEYKRIMGTPTDRQGQHALFHIVYSSPADWTGGYPYVDLLQPGLTEEFLRITYDPYKQRFGDEFGKTVRAAFTDEPHLRPAGQFHWTPGFPDLFKQRFGYDLLDALPSLFADTGDYRKVRHDVFEFLLDEFIDRWEKPYSEYCEKNQLGFTGHYWEHGWPEPSYNPDNMAFYAWHQIPAIDCLMNQYNEAHGAQFGNVRMVKELASVANQRGWRRRLCEVYGAGGWEMTFEDQKRIADWLGVLGVNFFDQHLCYMTLRGARKRDHPLSFSDHQPWWSHYHVMGAYLGRMSYALSTGEEQNRTLLLEPSTSAWLLHVAGAHNDELHQLGEEFQRFLTDLSLNQVEYDLGSERVLREWGSVLGKQLVVGQRKYDLVVLHATMSNLTSSTFKLLSEYLQQGGKVLLVGGRPQFVSGRPHDDLAKVFSVQPEKGQAILLPKEDGSTLDLHSQDQIIDYLNQSSTVQFKETKGGKLFHQTRQNGKEQLLYLCNISKEETSTGSWSSSGKSVRKLDLLTGEVSSTEFKVDQGKAVVSFTLPPAGSALYLITEEGAPSASPSQKDFQPVQAELKSIQRIEPNVLTVDYCDYQIDDKAGKAVYFYQAQAEIYKARGFAHNPWDSAVQYEDRILQREAEFKDGSGFSVTYHFTVEGFDQLPALSVVVEQAERYQITLNGKPLTFQGEWWLDRKFGMLDCAVGLVSGDNSLTITTNHFSIHHEVEPIYVLGDFSLTSTDKGWKIQPPKVLAYGSWREQGAPFFHHTVRYEYALTAPKAGSIGRVSLPSWQGTVSSVSLNGKSQGLIAWQPYELELPGLLTGENRIAIEVVGSPKNLLGPHHGKPGLGAAWPGGFRKAPESGPPPGTDYHTLDYGLMDSAQFGIAK
jgi:hypothetical protein